MKKIIVFILLFFALASIQAIDGTWILSNQFSQNITNGKATIQKINVSMLAKIQFTNTIINESNSAKRAYVTMLTSDNKYQKYQAEYKYSESLIVLWINRITDNVEIWLFLTPMDITTYYYSYAISSAGLNKNTILGTSEKERSFINMLGLMSKE